MHCIHAHMHECTPTYIHTCSHASVHSCIYKCHKCVYIDTHVYATHIKRSGINWYTVLGFRYIDIQICYAKTAFVFSTVLKTSCASDYRSFSR